VNEYPDPRTLDWNQWQGWDANDDFVMSDPNIPVDHIRHAARKWYDVRRLTHEKWFLPFLLGVVGVAIIHMLRQYACSAQKKRENLGYTELKV